MRISDWSSDVCSSDLQPIADVWPEFAAGGKGRATIEHALTHRAGVPAIDEVLSTDDIFDWSRMTAALAATHAWFPPGERLAYHTNTFGHLVGELIHRATGDMPGERLRRLADPLEAAGRFGVPAAEQIGRAACRAGVCTYV